MSEAGLSTPPLQLLCQPPLCLHLYSHPALVLALVRSSLLRLAVVLMEGRSRLAQLLATAPQDLVCALLTLLWALFLRRPIRAIFAVGGSILEGLGVADAADVVLSTDL